ncbi:non-specific lipid-transfer protein 3-like [Solanum tuberosum]|uniref:Non-specific lipid-transfer protein n=1 Tax=Solanum tuberosum TaxID=4113 RepID=M1DU64_SOLTU|nr:PREDICTED: non-specific lipid-transfer protein 3-like [Solanum tuberosum]
MAKILLTLFALALMLGQTNGVVQCEKDVIPLVKPCSGFALGKDAKPSKKCCVGLQSLAKIAAASESDRKTLCICISHLERSGSVNIVNYAKAVKLPDLCHFITFMPIEPNPDCYN